MSRNRGSPKVQGARGGVFRVDGARLERKSLWYDIAQLEELVVICTESGSFRDSSRDRTRGQIYTTLEQASLYPHASPSPWKLMPEHPNY